MKELVLKIRGRAAASATRGWHDDSLGDDGDGDGDGAGAGDGDGDSDCDGGGDGDEPE